MTFCPTFGEEGEGGEGGVDVSGELAELAAASDGGCLVEPVAGWLIHDSIVASIGSDGNALHEWV